MYLLIFAVLFFSFYVKYLPVHTLFIVFYLLSAPLWLDVAGSSVSFSLIVVAQASAIALLVSGLRGVLPEISAIRIQIIFNEVVVGA